jgi:hypothetical protein
MQYIGYRFNFGDNSEGQFPDLGGWQFREETEMGPQIHFKQVNLLP